MSREIRTETATIWVDEGGIAHIESTGVASTATSVEATIEALQDLLDGGRAPLLFDARRWPSSDTAGWVRFIELIETVCVAGAVLIDPEQPAVLHSYPEFMSRLVVPFAVFTTEHQAIAFLEPHALRTA